jgi:hypothetical protein
MFLHKRITLLTMKGHHGASACTEAATWMLQPNAVLDFCYGFKIPDPPAQDPPAAA